MSQVSTRSRGSIKKPTVVPKLRKKIAPKVISTRPKRNLQKSQADQQHPPANEAPQSSSQSHDPIVSATPTLQTSPANLSTLSNDSNNIPLPTLPSEEAPDRLSSSLQLPLTTEAEICTDVNDLFTDQHSRSSVDQDGGIGEELLHRLPGESLSEITNGTTDQTRTECNEAAVSDGNPGNESGSTARDAERESMSSAEAVSPTSSNSGVLDESMCGEGVSSGGPAAEEASINSEKPLLKTNRKRPQADSTVKESGDQLSPPRSKRKKTSVAKERKAPDRTTMTMQELIYYNPTANPMQAAREERERRRGSTAPPSPEKDTTNESETGSINCPTRQSSAERSGDSEERIVPQLRIGTDGNIIIDEASMMMATTQSANPYGDSEAIIETSGQVTSDSFRKGYKITRWSKDETNKFFKALSHVGTDFTMMTLLVPNRSRKELKNKFKREEKKSPQLIAQALKNQIKVQKVSS